MIDNEKPTTMRVALYLRVSTEDQAERFGIAMQKESLLGLIKSRGTLPDGSAALVLAEKHIYIDDGVSGTTPLAERPAFSRLQETILNAPEGTKPFDAVAVFKIDRFARRLKVLLDLIDFLRAYNIKFISANESIDTSTPFGNAILGIMGVIAELELETTKLRTKGGREEAVKRGIIMGPFPPYGFIKDDGGRLERFEPEAETVIRIFELFVNEKRSPQEIANFLMKEKILSPAASAVTHGKTKSFNKTTPSEFWRAERVAVILKDEHYIGNYYFNRYTGGGKLRPREEWKLSPYRIPQIIDPVTFDNAQKLLALQKHSRKNNRSDHVYLLSGLLRCNTCSNQTGNLAYWIGSRKELPDHPGRFTYSYQCGRKNTAKSPIGCNSLPMPAREIEGFILRECIRIVSEPKGIYEYQQKLTSTKAEIKHLEKRQTQLLHILNAIPQIREHWRQQNAEGLIEMAKLKQELNVLDEREKKTRTELDTVEEMLSKQTLSQGYIKSLEIFANKYKGSLDEIPKDRAKAYELLHSLIDSITVYSRPITADDKIAGKKRPNQHIPNELLVKLRLPQEFLNNPSLSSAQNSLNRRTAGN